MIIIIIITMSIKINLDQIFGSSSTQDHGSSNIESEQPSQSGSTYSYNNKYKFNMPIFDYSQVQSQTSTNHNNPNKAKSPSVVAVKSQFGDKAPGERLYYQSKTNMARKIQQHQRIMLQKALEEQKQATFKPKINKNTEKILNNKNKYQTTTKKKYNQQAIPTHQKKQQQQIIHCTFKPQLIAKSSSGAIRYKQKQKVFQQLFNDHKLKEVRQKLKTEENINEPKKKLTKQQFQNFINRNNQFINKVQKKKELIISTSKKFDLQTGNKLFSPKTNSFKSHKSYFSGKAEQKQIQNQQDNSPIRRQIKPKGIFAKNYQQYDSENTSLKTNKQRFEQEYYAKKSNQDIKQIREAKQHQQEEQVADERPNYQTVNAFESQQEQENNKQSSSRQKLSLRSFELSRRQKNKIGQIQSLENLNQKQVSPQKRSFQDNQQDYNNESPGNYSFSNRSTQWNVGNIQQ